MCPPEHEWRFYEDTKEAFARVRNRPLILIFPAIATLLLCIIEQFNPFVKYGSLKTLITLDYMEEQSLHRM